MRKALPLLLSALLLAGAAQAAPPMGRAIAPPPRPAAPVADDGLAGGGFYLEADSVTQNDASHHVIAEGKVEARYRGRTLRADQLDYETQSGVVTARGHVTILNPDGSSQFASEITLDKDMSAGVALGFSTRLNGDIKIAAARAERKSAEVTELDRVIYTPCQVCAENGHGKPTWSIRARKVVEDRAHKTIYFQDAVIQVMGVGVIYLPAFWTADPSAVRKSGFLLPVVTISGKRGFSYEQPYYQVITPSQDIEISPQINSKVNPFLNLEYRRRFYSGVADIRAGYTYEKDFTSGGDRFGALTSRSYILGSGVFDLSPHWQWGFTAERASDKLIFDKYSIGDVFRDRGLYAADDRRLISQLYAVRQDEQSYVSVAAISVQGLRPNDDQSTFPTVAPLIEARFEPSQPIVGGRLRLDASAVALTRDQSPNTPGDPGADSRRATAGLDWRRTFTLSNGVRLSPFILGRADLYSLSGLPAPEPSDATVTRAFGTLGLDISYPLIKQSAGVTYILEPLGQIDLSPDTKLDPRIPNEDSQVWEFDETNLFQPNKSPGFDLYEGGQRINIGGRATAMLPDGRSGSLLIGRSFRTGDDPALPARTGLRTAASDYILAAEATPLKGVSLFTRWRMDSGDFSINRLEAGVDLATSRANGYISYLQEANSPTGQRVRSLDLHGEVFATRHWGASVYAIVDQGAWRRRDFGVVYRDDCVRMEVLYRHDETFSGPQFGPSSSVVFRLTLATLGNSGYSR